MKHPRRGAGKFSKGDKRRYDLCAAGSSTESAAMLDVCLRRKLISEDSHRRGKSLLDCAQHQHLLGHEGPEGIIGEGSYALARELGIDPHPVSGGADESP